MLSLEQLRQRIDQALAEKFGRDPESGWVRYYSMETFPGYVVAHGPEGRLYRIEYAIGIGDEIQLGEPSEVEQVYVPVAETAAFDAGDGAGADDFTYPVTVIKAGVGNAQILSGTKQLRQRYPVAFVAEVAAAVNGARFGRRHPRPDEHEAAQPEAIAGWFSNGRMVGEEARATLHLLENETELAAKLAAARKAKKLDLFGLSILAYVGYRLVKEAGEELLEAVKLGRLARVDLVAEPAAGGRFLEEARLAAAQEMFKEIAVLQGAAQVSSGLTGGESGGAQRVGRKQGAAMKERILKVLAALRKFDAGRAEELNKELEGLPDDKHPEFLGKASEALAAAAEAKPPAQENKPAAAAEPKPQDVLAKANEALAKAEKIQSQSLVTEKLAASKLPAEAAKYVRTQLEERIEEGRPVTEAICDAQIEKARTAFAAFTATGRVSASGIEVGMESTDKVQAAMDAMLGVKEVPAGTRPFRGVKEAYVFITGDRDFDFGRNGRGGFLARVAAATILTSDFPNLLLNSMTKKAIQDYREVGMGGVEQLFTPASVTDFKTQDRVRDGYFADLATVAEDAAYTDFAKPTDEKISYAVGKYGNLLPITEETIRNDDLGKITRFPAKIARAARRTLKQVITNFFINNPNFDPDAVAWFHATHNNLGSVALSAGELDAREILLMKQTEKDSGKRLGLPLEWLMIPVDLKSTAYQINQNNEGANSWFQRFGAQNERIIVNELLTDANDWYCGALPSNAPFLEIGFLDGIQEPQIFLDNNPASGGVTFTNDRIRYKVKMVFGGDILDFRSVQKNVVA